MYRIESNDPSIYMRDLGVTPEPALIFFSLHWGDREIPVCTRIKSRSFGRNEDGQIVYETDWIIESIGKPDYAAGARCEPYQFTSQEERICAVGLAVKGLQVYGGRFNRPEWNSFPVARRISVTVSDELKYAIYRETN